MALYYRPSHPHVSAQLCSFSKFIIWPSFTKMSFSHSGSLFIFALRMNIVFTSPLFVATHSSSSPSHHALGDGHGCMYSTGGVGTGELDRRRARESTAVRGRRMTEPQSLPAIPNNVPCASRIDPLSILRLHDAPTAAAPLLISKSGAKTTQNHPAHLPVPIAPTIQAHFKTAFHSSTCAFSPSRILGYPRLNPLPAPSARYLFLRTQPSGVTQLDRS